MKVVIAIDSYKGSLSSFDAGKAAEKGVKKAFPDAQTYICPVADGGEGTVNALVHGANGRFETVTVTGPLGEPVSAQYGVLEDNTAVIEMSAAAGITLVKESERNPLNTTTYGVGELIIDAVNKGLRNFIIGIGGSATNDGGAGMLQALGVGLYDDKLTPIPLGAKGLKVLKTIDDKDLLPELSECSFKIACDVTNPLCGELGCSAVYGPQKGADSQMIKDMDMWLSDYARLVKTIKPLSDKNFKGAGAAGGIGFAFLSFLNAELKNGIELVITKTKLEKQIQDADFVITGEGRLDSQSVMGKVPVGVANLAKKYNIPVLAFSGSVTEDATVCNEHGIDAFFPITRKVCSLKEAMMTENASNNLSATVEQVFRAIRAVR